MAGRSQLPSRAIAKILLALLLQLAWVSATAQASHVERYDTQVQLQPDGSTVSTRTLDVVFHQPEHLFHFSFTTSIVSGGYRFSYRYTLLSAEADFGKGFQFIPTSTSKGSDWNCVLGDSTREFSTRMRFRLKLRSWGDTFWRDHMCGFHYFAVSYRQDDGTAANVGLEIPKAAATGARFDCVVGPYNSIDGIMVCQSLPYAKVPEFVEAHFVAPNRATFTLLRPMAKGEAISIAAYMPNQVVPRTLSYRRTSPTLTSLTTDFLIVAVVGLCAVGALAGVFFALSRSRRIVPPPPMP